MAAPPKDLPDGCAQPSITLVPGDPTPFSGHVGTICKWCPGLHLLWRIRVQFPGPTSGSSQLSHVDEQAQTHTHNFFNIIGS